MMLFTKDLQILGSSPLFLPLGRSLEDAWIPSSHVHPINQNGIHGIAGIAQVYSRNSRIAQLNCMSRYQWYPMTSFLTHHTSSPMPNLPGLLSLLANLLSPVKRGPAEILQNSAAALLLLRWDIAIQEWCIEFRGLCRLPVKFQSPIFF